MCAMEWVVAVTKHCQEAWAAENVERQGFGAYYPRFEEEFFNRKHHLDTRVRCLFPRYLFVRTDGPWIFLMSTFGVIGVVRKGEAPAVIADSEIEQLRQREGKDGLIHLPPKPGPPRFANGQKVRVTYGPFSGLKGICQGDSSSERVRILLQFLGRKSGVTIARDALIAA